MTFENDRSSRESWLDRIDDIEDSARSISAAGMAADFGMVHHASMAGQRVLGKFIELSRRNRRLTVEDLAAQADVDLSDLVELETNESAAPEPRTVYQLSQVFGVPAQAMMELAGLATARGEVNNAAVRFAARAESISDLSEQERSALEEFVGILVHTVGKG